MELNQIRAFLSVARTGQLVRSADQLHLTQSALSKQIKGFEEELGLLLFVRTPAGMALTGEGRRLIEPATRALDAVRELTTKATSMRGTVSGTLRLGTIVDPDSIRLGPLLAALVQYYPQVDTSLQHGISGSVLKLLRDGQVDAGFYLGPLTAPDIAMRQLMLEHYVVIGPASWGERLHGATWTELAAMPWMSTPAESSQHGLVRQMFAEQGLVFRSVVEADQEASMLELVQTGVALGLMRERIAAPFLRQGLVAAWPGVRLPCPLSLLYRRETEGSPLVQALLATLQLVWPIEDAQEY